MLHAVAEYQPVFLEVVEDRVHGPDHPGIVEGEEVGKGEEEEGRIDLAGAEELDEDLPALVVALTADRVTDLLGDLLPALDGSLAKAFPGQGQSPVECGPAHHLAVHEVLRLAADLPDPTVGFDPALGGEVHQLDDEAPEVVVRGMAAEMPAPAQVDQGAVGVELELLGGRVADPDRARMLVAVEPVEDDLGEPSLASDAVHDLEIAGATRRAPLDEAPEAVRLVVGPDRGQRASAHRRVADPAEAVVPVPLAAKPLRQRGRRRRRDRPGGGEGQPLEGDRRAHHGGAMGALEVDLFGPAPPPEGGLVKPVVELGRVGDLGQCELEVPRPHE